MRPERLYYVTRADLSEGRRAAQLIHACDEWSVRFGPQQGTVIVYEVPTEADLHLVAGYVARQPEPWTSFREPDLDHQLTALVTAHGPMDLPLLGRHRPAL